ncbi:hypothetical protein F5884DRAFT_863710 [Xylogone sp. PMI_703]|nr:hypothetical protein F5884DRAFT_863710 [Xylogone sp. PMI_703]
MLSFNIVSYAGLSRYIISTLLMVSFSPDTTLSNIIHRQTPTLPTITDTTTLPAPASTLSIKHIALGYGLQNYSCAAINSRPVPIGALATLFDFTPFAFADENGFNTIPSIVVYITPPSFHTLSLITEIFPLLGYHYFSADGTPVFDLTGLDKYFYGKKTADLRAPASAAKGPAGTGAVDWLQLQDKGASIGVREVYRVVTAGGAAPDVCTVTGIISIQYAAEYWFYD